MPTLHHSRRHGKTQALYAESAAEMAVRLRAKAKPGEVCWGMVAGSGEHGDHALRALADPELWPKGTSVWRSRSGNRLNRVRITAPRSIEISIGTALTEEQLMGMRPAVLMVVHPYPGWDELWMQEALGADVFSGEAG